MTDRNQQELEAFEKWMKGHHPLDWFAAECGEPLPTKYRLAVWEYARKVWQARAALESERIAELERERDEARAEADRLWELHHQSVRQLTDARARLARIHACMGDETKSLAHRVGFAEEASRER